MRAPLLGHRSGPFLIPARVLLLLAGLVAIALGAFNLGHELHAAEVDIVYTVVAGVVAAIWLVSLLLVFRGIRVGAFLAGLIAFVEFGVTASAHFVSGPAALSAFARHEGLPLATVVMGLVPACALGFTAALVAWSHPTGRRRRLETLPLVIVAVVGAILAILAATDANQRSDFGTANPEDAMFIAAVTSAAWLLGALWIARVRRTGAIVIALATFNIWYSFVALHLLKGGAPVSEIASKSGSIWAVIAVAAAVLAAASFLFALALLALSMVRRKPAAVPVGTKPARRGA
jgi:hypothetical protein